MNHSIYSADHATHLKIVAIALAAGIAGTSLGLSARPPSDAGSSRSADIVEPGRPVVITYRDASVIR